MATGLFDAAAESLEQRTSLNRLEARGTLRIALKTAGLEAKGLTAEQLGVVFEKVLPQELAMRGIEDAADVCAAVMASILGSAAAAETAGTQRTVSDVFSRLGGD